ncbi:prepilin-type N-terminal cleavage/methylation domain-containing protein [Sporomusa sp.]|uniref:prepilin-type N-terminal cleavage/methylation domain-containing protein n=1 Tax=Sporomusa sp. TaxID=2078658 RepID=UPI002BB64D1A|nr:prepilin-type N-terminal cleavage/methylation domain-containing protein [Sporomusa sp.]HWR43660.1 prepilin-type N-terminal cleavage/methylation domain-containing protein [Sporomusa sp.]
MFRLKFSKYLNSRGMTLIELIIAIAIMGIVFAGIGNLFTTSVIGWKNNSDRLNHVQDQIDSNNLLERINNIVRFSNTLTSTDKDKITFTVNDPSKTVATPVTWTIYTVADPNDSSMKRVVVDQVPSNGTQDLLNVPFSKVEFYSVDTNSVRIVVRRSTNGTDQNMIVAFGGFK